MTDLERDLDNAEQLGIPPALVTEHDRLMAAKMTEWPDELWKFVKERCNQSGMCGGVIAQAVADWLRGTLCDY